MKLASPSALKQIDFREDDMFDLDSKPKLGSFDVVRAANILNKAYFPEARLRQAVTTIRNLLRGSGSYFIVTRTDDDRTNCATMFKLAADGRFEPVVNLNGGAEISAIVTALPSVALDRTSSRS